MLIPLPLGPSQLHVGDRAIRDDFEKEKYT